MNAWQMQGGPIMCQSDSEISRNANSSYAHKSQVTKTPNTSIAKKGKELLNVYAT
jgi:hypothetical protein